MIRQTDDRGQNRKLEALAAIAADGAEACRAGRWTPEDAAGCLAAMAGDLYALAFGYAAALDVPRSADLPRHAAAAIAAACGDDSGMIRGACHAAA